MSLHRSISNISSYHAIFMAYPRRRTNSLKPDQPLIFRRIYMRHLPSDVDNINQKIRDNLVVIWVTILFWLHKVCICINQAHIWHHVTTDNNNYLSLLSTQTMMFCWVYMHIRIVYRDPICFWKFEKIVLREIRLDYIQHACDYSNVNDTQRYIYLWSNACMRLVWQDSFVVVELRFDN